MKFIQLSLVLVICIFSCTSSIEPLNEPTYEACCETRPIERSVGAGNIFIPNMFISNHRSSIPFTVHSDESIAMIEKLEVENVNGEVIFSKEDFRTNNVDIGWEGENINEENKGLCTFKATVLSTDNERVTVSGLLCVFYCEGEEKLSDINSLVSCAFGIQHDGKGSADSSIYIPLEDDCDL